MNAKKPAFDSSKTEPPRTLGGRTMSQNIRHLEVMTEALAKCCIRPPEKVLECQRVIAEHLHNVKNGVEEPPEMEEKVRSAIIDYPVQLMGHGMVVGDETSMAIDILQSESRYQSVRDVATRFMELTMNYLDILV